MHMTMCDGASSVMKLIDSDFMLYAKHLKVHVEQDNSLIFTSKNLDVFAVDGHWVILKDFKPVKVVEVSPDLEYNAKVIEKTVQAILHVDLPLENSEKVVEYLKQKSDYV